MSFITGPVGPSGPLVQVSVKASRPRMDAMKQAGLPIPDPIAVTALIDTGAYVTCIDASIISQLGIPASGQTQILTPSTGTGSHLCLQYDVSLTLASPDHGYSFTALSVIESYLSFHGFQALIGRDVLKQCLLIYDGQSDRYTLAF